MAGKPRTNMKRFWDRVDIKDRRMCWNWNGFTNPHGYGLVRLNGNKQLAHRLAYLFTFGTVPDGMYVLHHCDNPACCNPKHLYSGTAKDNAQDMLRRERVSRVSRNAGEKCAMAKLKDDDVRMIRKVYSTNKITQKELGKEYGVGQDTISMIVNHKHWKGVG